MQNNVQSILKFNLDTQEGRDAHVRACKAEQAYRALNEIEELLRKYDKYDLPPKLSTLTADELANHIRMKVSETIIENGIDLTEEYR